jgi:hypothetical protein
LSKTILKDIKIKYVKFAIFNTDGTVGISFSFPPKTTEKIDKIHVISFLDIAQWKNCSHDS